jgi:hypothetical protein
MNAATAELELDSVTDIDATLNYRLPNAHAFEIDARTVTIHDARRVYGLGFDRSGFELLRHHGTLGNWQAFSDAALVRDVDYPEMGQAIRARLQASKVLVIDHRLRAGGPAWEEGPRRFEPVRLVHSTPTFRSAAQQVLRHLDGPEAAQRLQRRFAVIHVWRPSPDGLCGCHWRFAMRVQLKSKR